MSATVADLRTPIIASQERISIRLQKVDVVFNSFTEYFRNEWRLNGTISEVALSRQIPGDTIKQAVAAFDEFVLPVLRDLSLRLYVDHGKWVNADANRRFDETHRNRLKERIIPILQSGLVVEMNQFYAIHVQLSHVDDHDGEELLSHAMTGVGMVLHNPIAWVRAGTKILDAVQGNTPKERLTNKLIQDRDEIAKKIESRLSDVHQMILGLISSWLTEEVATEAQVSLRMNELERENDKLKQAPLAQSAPQVQRRIQPPVHGHAASGAPATTIIIIVLLSILTTAVVILGAVQLLHKNS